MMESVAEEEEGEEEDSMDSGCTTGCLGVFRKHDDEVRSLIIQPLCCWLILPIQNNAKILNNH